MKITIYTVNDCKFSQQEKEYLKARNLSFEEKNLELNKEWLTEMLAISNNFAGTPVTRIEKDDGAIRVFKGFTKEEFDEFLGFTVSPQETPGSSPAAQPPLANQISGQEASSTSPALSSPPPQTQQSLPQNQLNDQSPPPSNSDHPSPSVVQEDQFKSKINEVLEKLEESTQPSPATSSPTSPASSSESSFPQQNEPVSQEFYQSDSIPDLSSSISEPAPENDSFVDKNSSTEDQPPINLPNIPDFPEELKK
ncbi:MAG: hypothetical protein NZL96_02140 [Patescibacteria group bacterium]|nr:hypothetical protein [Patescibacteria group bacterium]